MSPPSDLYTQLKVGLAPQQALGWWLFLSSRGGSSFWRVSWLLLQVSAARMYEQKVNSSSPLPFHGQGPCFASPFPVSAGERGLRRWQSTGWGLPGSCSHALLLQPVGDSLPEGLSFSAHFECAVGQWLAEPCPAFPSLPCGSVAVEVSAVLAQAALAGVWGGFGSSQCPIWTPTASSSLMCGNRWAHGQDAPWTGCHCLPRCLPVVPCSVGGWLRGSSCLTDHLSPHRVQPLRVKDPRPERADDEQQHELWLRLAPDKREEISLCPVRFSPPCSRQPGTVISPR